ncbi:PAS domain S-box protein [Methanocalculus taiwanensis]|uniref:histidine kinase n=1 Tax=Methanocalculus taiwanensis TaxID=106207 RepID=A0ABD4TIP0_9EURY|nr:PAS domain S-box protein [Methanocalculus taiwanensis]
MTDTPGWVLPSLLVSSSLCALISYLAFASGVFIIVQNLYYIPIIIACIYYGWRGLFFSIFLAISYLALIASFTPDPLLLQEAMIRVIFFSIVAGVITALSQFREKTGQQLRESEDRYRNVVEDQTEFICRFLPDGTTVFVNEAYCRYFGLVRDQILGKRFKPLIHPDDREMVGLAFASLTQENPAIMINQRIIMPDGSIRWQRWSDRAIFDSDGTIIEWQSVGRDITEQKDAEDALRASEIFNRTLIEHLPDYVILYDRDGRIQYCNPSITDALGYSLDEMIGMSIISFVPEECRSLAQQMLTERSEGRKVHPYEMRIRNKKGRLMTVLVQGSAMQYGDSCSILIVMTDITERKLTEELQKEAYGQIEENMYRLSILNDQVRNPLSVITGLVDLEPGENAEKILEQVKEINRIITLLDLGVLESESIRAFMRKHDQLSEPDLQSSEYSET